MLAGMFEKMVLIRTVEKKIEQLFSQGMLFGTAHSCVGQEAIATGVVEALDENDIITSNHRGHGHYLAYTGDVEGLIAEVMGRETGVCGGRGGSQHLYKKNFYSNGITGGMTPVATGMAMAEKMKGSSACVVSFLGDGAVGEGVFYEAMNMASLWKLPIVFVVENNQYAMSTPVSLGVQGRISDRGRAAGIESFDLDTPDVMDIQKFFSDLRTEVKRTPAPKLVVFNTYRLCGHSKSDDCCYRPDVEEACWEEKDPVRLAAERLDSELVEEIHEKARLRVDLAVDAAAAAPWGRLPEAALL